MHSSWPITMATPVPSPVSHNRGNSRHKGYESSARPDGSGKITFVHKRRSVRPRHRYWPRQMHQSKRPLRGSLCFCLSASKTLHNCVRISGQILSNVGLVLAVEVGQSGQVRNTLPLEDLKNNITSKVRFCPLYFIYFVFKFLAMLFSASVISLVCPN